MRLMEKFKDDNAVLIVSMVLLALLILIFVFVDSKAAVGLTGVIIGGILSSVTTIIISRSDYQKQLKLSALEKRLEAHQIAYSFWFKIMSNIYKPEIIGIAEKAKEWWIENCLYLGPKSRKAFIDCAMYTIDKAAELKSLKDHPRTGYEKFIKDSWDLITLPGKTLIEEVNLPSFGEEEYIKSEMEKNI